MKKPQPLLAHRYRILRKLGSGGFGDTFLAKDTHLPSGKTCVIKQLKPIEENQQVYQLVKDRFEREAVILEDLGNNHSQIPNLYAYFEDRQKFYLVQEYIEGQTLDKLVAQKGQQTEEFVKKLVLNILTVLDFIQSKGIIHRDIKPDNIIIRKSDRLPVLIDFGAVRETMGTQMSSSGNSTRSIIIGTPGFMPPEQSAGRPMFASDLYSLGLTAIYLLTGKIPQELPSDPLTGDILWQSEAQQVSQPLADLLNQAINPQIAERFPTAQAMREALEGKSPTTTVKTVASTAGTPDSTTSFKEDKKTHKGKVGIILAGVGTLAVGGIIFASTQSNQPSTSNETAVVPEPATIVEDSIATPSTEPNQSALLERQAELERQLAEQAERLRQQEEALQPPPPQISPPSPTNVVSRPQRGMWVLDVTSNSEADIAGIQSGQILVSLNGTYVDQVGTANSIVGQNTNQPIQATVWENGVLKQLTVTPRDQYIGVNLCQLSRCPNGREP